MSDENSRPAGSAKNQEVSASASGWVASGSFLGSILAGTLLGYLADVWLGTRPWLIVVGILAGSYAGFVTMWRLSEEMENIDRRAP